VRQPYRTESDARQGLQLATANTTTQFLAHLAAGMTLIIAASIAVLAIAFRPPRLIYPPYRSPVVCTKPILELGGDRRVKCLLAVMMNTRKS